MSRKVTAEARAERKAKEKADYDAHIKRIVAEAPPLSDAQLDYLAVLLRPVIHGNKPLGPREPSAYELEQRRIEKERADGLRAAMKAAEALTACDICDLQPDAHTYQNATASYHEWEPGRAARVMGKAQ